MIAPVLEPAGRSGPFGDLLQERASPGNGRRAEETAELEEVRRVRLSNVTKSGPVDGAAQNGAVANGLVDEGPRAREAPDSILRASRFGGSFQQLHKFKSWLPAAMERIVRCEMSLSIEPFAISGPFVSKIERQSARAPERQSARAPERQSARAPERQAMTASGACRADASGTSRRPESTGSFSRPARAVLPDPFRCLFGSGPPRIGALGGFAAALALLVLAVLAPSGPAQAQTVPGLSATAAPGNSIRVTWNAVASATAYRVFWKTAGQQYSGDRATGILSSSSASHTIASLTPGTAYDVRVAAYRVGQSTPIAESDVTFTVPYPAVTGLAVTAASPTSLRVTWDAVTNASGYRVFWKTTGQQYSTTTRNSPASTSRAYTIGSLTTGAVYDVRVRAYSGSVVIAESEQSVTQTTPAVTGLTATAASSTSIKVT